MKFHWTDVTMTALLVGAGCTVVYSGLMYAMRRAFRERQLDTERELNAIATTVNALQERIAELGRLQTTQQKMDEITSIQAVAEPKQEAAKPEIVAALTAAATAFLGKKARILAAHSLPAEADGAGKWARSGRVIVQTSHNFRPRR